MPSNFELHILKVQGVSADLSIVGCYVSLDGRLYDVITPLSSQTPDSVVLLPNSGQLKLMIKKMSSGDDQVIGSVSFSLSLFPSVGGQFWVPLFESYSVASLGTETQGPKLLLKVTMPRMLPPVNETTENSIEDSSLEQFSHAKAEEESNLSRVTFGDVSLVEASKDEPSSIKPDDRESQSILVTELRTQLENLQQLLRLEKAQRETQESKLKAVFSEYEAAQKRMMAREKTLTGHLLEKDKELFRCIEENTELKIAARQTESEMYQLQERIRLMEAQNASAALSSSSEALDYALEQLRESEQRRKDLQSQVLNSADIIPPQTELMSQVSDLRSKVAALDGENSDLKAREQKANREIQQLKDQLLRTQHETDFIRSSLQPTPEVRLDVEVIEGLSSRTTPSAVGSVIDRLLDEYFEERNQPNPFIRTGENTYLLDNKKFTLAIRNSALVAKVGTGFVYLEEILKSSRRVDVQKQPFSWNAPRLVTGGRSTSAGRERRHSADKETSDASTSRGHKKGESEVPITFSRDRPLSPKKQVVSPVLFKPVKTSLTPLKERSLAKKAGAVSAEKVRKPFR